MALAWTISSLLVGWYNGRGARPLFLAGMVAWYTSFMIIGARRRWKAARDGTTAGGRLQFSMAELFLIVTGIVALVGFLAAEHRQSLSVHREREKFSALAAPILGPGGRLGFESSGEMTIIICDRSFDDDRLGRLASIISQKEGGAVVKSLVFGSRANSIGAPSWPGVTDRSLDVIVRWKQLEWLFIEGTAITPAGRQRLLTLPALNETSRNSLQDASH